jgi:hypothetical protein
MGYVFFTREKQQTKPRSKTMRFTRKLPEKEGFYLMMRKAWATPEVIYVKDSQFAYEKALWGSTEYTFPIEDVKRYAFHGPLNIQQENIWKG